MKPYFISAGAAVMLALWVAGCESDGGVTARKQEKAETYATLRPWQKTLIDGGAISNSFTPDMVYMALGKPDKVETKEFPEGTAEMWTYSHFYPNVDAIHGFRHTNFTTESAYQPQREMMQTSVDSPTANGPNRQTVPMGMERGGAESVDHTGGPQGGTMEPASLRSYTIKVLFASGKVVRFGADENVN